MTDLPTSLPCNWARTRQPHPSHDWEPQPGMDPVHCPGHGQPGAIADWHAAGCARDCSEQHTYAWGRCALAPESARPEPTISIGRVETEANGQPGIVLRSIPLTAWDALITVAKWVSRGKSMALDADPDIALAYPDAAARRALGALHDAGLLDPTEPHLAAVQAAAHAEGTDTATWTAVRAIQLMNEAGQQRDEARAAIERVRGLADRLDEFAENALRVDDQKLYAAIASDIRTRIDGTAAEAPDGAPCSCGGRFPLAHLHADQHQPKEQP